MAAAPVVGEPRGEVPPEVTQPHPAPLAAKAPHHHLDDGWQLVPERQHSSRSEKYGCELASLAVPSGDDFSEGDEDEDEQREQQQDGRAHSPSVMRSQSTQQHQQYLSVPGRGEAPDEALVLLPAKGKAKHSHHHGGSTTVLDLIPEDGPEAKRTGGDQRRVSGDGPATGNGVAPSVVKPSALMAAIRRGSLAWLPGRRAHGGTAGGAPAAHDPESNLGSKASLSQLPGPATGPHSEQALESRRKNRRFGDDALSTALSALYAKIIVILGIALPVTEILSSQIPANVYQGFYLFLYTVSIAFVIFVYASTMRQRAVMTRIQSYHARTSSAGVGAKKRVPHFGSFYLRVGAIAFGIGTMVYSGLEFGQYFELNASPGCSSIFIALTPAARMLLSLVQMQFIFLNASELDMARHKVFARFGLMHMVATNLCEWLYVLVEETKHEIHHLAHSAHHNARPSDAALKPSAPSSLRGNETEMAAAASLTASSVDSVEAEHHECQRTNIMGSLVQNVSPFLFPCTIEYSLICAVILYEMWKKVKTIAEIDRTRRSSIKVQTSAIKSAHHFSVDCSRAHRGMFGGILLTVLTIICLIMYFVLYDEPGYEYFAIQEVTIAETLMYTVTAVAVLVAMLRMRDLRYQRKKNDLHSGSVSLDCTLLVLAQTGVYVYGMFSIVGSYFSMKQDVPGAREGLIAELFGLVQTSIQTLFILNAVWRKCRGAQQHRTKPGRQIVTFLLVANMAMWFINTLIKGRASFRPSHLDFFGTWAWTVITHVSMPLAIFYRFHSTICLFEIWKSTYKVKVTDYH
ncbi:proton channel OtopLc [Anopheles cruzii]|uniref:proton channel OtopLc n=1 Tax=Anopheles cruzii TaxID=68878 RepID=UPI0022EC8B6E|nr:proton channel OtopLc [Anopheles cruzii]